MTGCIVSDCESLWALVKKVLGDDTGLFPIPHLIYSTTWNL